MGDGRVVVVSGHVGGTRRSGIVSSAAAVFGMSVVRGIRGVGGVCEMTRGGLGGEVWENKGSVGRVFGLRWCMRGVGRRLGRVSERVKWCYVYVSCAS